MRFLWPALVLLAAAAGLYGADDLQQVYSKMDSASTTFRGLTADIRRDARTDLINEDDVETGKIVVKRSKPNDLRMRIDFSEPNEKQAALSGSKAEIYYPKATPLRNTISANTRTSSSNSCCWGSAVRRARCATHTRSV